MDNRRTRAQLRYLRRLADRTGRTFAWPRTKAQAATDRSSQDPRAEPRLAREDQLANWS